LRQVRDALLVELEIERLKGCPRTVVVVHNGLEGSRGAIARYEREVQALVADFDATLLLRPIERWDIDELTSRIWVVRECLRYKETLYQQYMRSESSLEALVDFKIHFEVRTSGSASMEASARAAEELFKRIVETEHRFGPLKDTRK
jgi:hypothetical protein